MMPGQLEVIAEKKTVGTRHAKSQCKPSICLENPVYRSLNPVYDGMPTATILGFKFDGLIPILGLEIKG